MHTAANLRNKLKAISEADTSETWRVRMHRAISWFTRSEKEREDLDARFIFQWIALNAAYAREFGPEESERYRANRFLGKLVKLDVNERLHDVLFHQFTGPIRTLMENRYVFDPFWTALRQHDSSNSWEVSFSNSRKRALASIVNRDTAVVLSLLFDRLYVLRNQLVHGGATWNSKVNRAQLKDAVTILAALIPRMLDLMLDPPDHDFGAVLYPRV